MEAKLSEKEFSLFLKYYTISCEEGKSLYLSEIVIPDERYYSLLSWLDKCEEADLLYFFTVIERYKGYKLLYGFSNFEVKEFKDTRIFYFTLPGEYAFKANFNSWKKESSYCVVPTNLHDYVKVIINVASEVENNS